MTKRRQPRGRGLAGVRTREAAIVPGFPVRNLGAPYNDFLTLWKDADPDIPVLIQAKAEYVKLK